MSAKYYNILVPCKAFLQTYGKQFVNTMRAEYKPKIANQFLANLNVHELLKKHEENVFCLPETKTIQKKVT